MLGFQRYSYLRELKHPVTSNDALRRALLSDISTSACRFALHRTVLYIAFQRVFTLFVCVEKWAKNIDEIGIF